MAAMLFGLGCPDEDRKLCNDSHDCLSEQVCFQGFCRSNCATDRDCRSGESCNHGLCLTPLDASVRRDVRVSDAPVDREATSDGARSDAAGIVDLRSDTGPVDGDATLHDSAEAGMPDVRTNLCGNGELDPGELCDPLLHPGRCDAECRVIRKLALGGLHSCLLFESGMIKCWGRGSNGVLGTNHWDCQGCRPENSGLNMKRVFLPSGDVVVDLDLGYNHACGLLSDGRVKCWGNNAYGQLGQGHLTPIGNAGGEMGQLPAIDLGPGRPLQVGAGNGHSCALIEGGLVKCWGNSFQGQLGYGDKEDRGDGCLGAEEAEPERDCDVTVAEMGTDLPAVDLAGVAVEIFVGGRQSCARLTTGELRCWGYNYYFGALGLGDELSRGNEPGEMGEQLPAVQLGTGLELAGLSLRGDHAVARFEQGSLKCWGRNDWGELGYNHMRDLGDDGAEMGDVLPSVSLPAVSQVEGGAAGAEFSCALLSDGRVRCWGRNSSGQLGLGDLEDRGDGCDVEGVCEGVEEMGDNLPALDLLGEDVSMAVQQVAAGDYHACALFTDGRVKCWGQNGYGQLGVGDELTRGTSPAHMGGALPFVGLE